MSAFVRQSFEALVVDLFQMSDRHQEWLRRTVEWETAKIHQLILSLSLSISNSVISILCSLHTSMAASQGYITRIWLLVLLSCFLVAGKLPLSPTLTGCIKQKANQMMKRKRMMKCPWTILRRLVDWKFGLYAHGGFESCLKGMYDCLEEDMKWISSWGWGNCNVWREEGGRDISVLHDWGLTSTIPHFGGGIFAYAQLGCKQELSVQTSHSGVRSHFSKSIFILSIPSLQKGSKQYTHVFVNERSLSIDY